MCKTGCPFVKNIYGENKSYTCKLQQEIYKDNATLYGEDEYNRESVYMYLNKMHPHIAEKFYPEEKQGNAVDMVSLRDIIAEDEKLKKIYDPDIFILKVDDREYKLESQISL